MADRVHEHEIAEPHPRLRPFVTEYAGYRLAGFEPGVHAGLPSRSLTGIIAFDEPLDVTMGFGSGKHDRYWAMIGGLHQTPAAVRHTGSQHGIQLAVTPLGARALFGVPAAAIADATIHIEDVAPSMARELVDRLFTATTWRGRYAVLDEVFLRVVEDGHRLGPEVDRAWTLLAANHGSTPIGEVAEAVGWTRPHLTKRFRETFGLTPKTMARVLRFERAQQLLRLPTKPSLASVAAACGYADQAHLSRDWQQFAGAPPTEWLRDDTLPFVQDDGTPIVAS